MGPHVEGARTNTRHEHIAHTASTLAAPSSRKVWFDGFLFIFLLVGIKSREKRALPDAFYASAEGEGEEAPTPAAEAAFPRNSRSSALGVSWNHTSSALPAGFA